MVSLCRVRLITSVPTVSIAHTGLNLTRPEDDKYNTVIYNIDMPATSRRPFLGATSALAPAKRRLAGKWFAANSV